MRIETERWLNINGGFYRTLNFTPKPTHVCTDSLVEFEIDGIMTAMVMVQLLVEPYPVNPFLVYAALLPKGPECLEFLMDPPSPDEDYKREYLFAMIPDKDTRKALAELFKLSKGRKASALEAIQDILLRRAIEDPIGAPATYFVKPRDDAQHANIRSQLFNVLLIGHDEPWTHPHFEAFARGLHLGLCGVPSIMKAPLEHETEEDTYLYAFQLVSTLWNNRITGPGDLTRRIHYRIFNPLRSRKAMLFAELFRTRFVRWLGGKGHPRELVGGIVTEEMYEKSRKSRKIRAELFWKAVSDLEVLPGNGKGWKITVSSTSSSCNLHLL